MAPSDWFDYIGSGRGFLKGVFTKERGMKKKGGVM